MERWKRASNYMGQEYPEYFVLLGRNRDSNLLDVSNFETAYQELQDAAKAGTIAGETPDGEEVSYLIARSGHWACGWVELLLIHQSDARAVALGEKIEARLASYPVLDE